MNPVATQQAALNNALVPSEKRLKIKRCNARIAFSKPQREETYQNRDIDAYSFKLDKKKCRVDTEVFREILQIYPRILNQDFIAPPSEKDLVTFIQELGYSGRCASLGKQQDLIDSGSHDLKSYGDKTISMRNMINLHIIRDDLLLGTLKFVSKTQDYQQKARKYKKVASPSRKLSPVKEAKPVKKGKRVKRPAKKFTTLPTTGVAIRDTLGVLDEQQHKTSGTDEGIGTKPRVPDVPTYDSKSEMNHGVTVKMIIMMVVMITIKVVMIRLTVMMW
nr:hypothetical protein [Tanacetum cinerariifolium]